MNKNLKKQYLYNVAFGIVCVLVLVILRRYDGPGLRSLVVPGADNSFYNLLVQGFNAGQLNIITPAPEGLTRLANPYDVNAVRKYLVDFQDMSYFKGKLYLYYGVAPALALYWPFFLATGDFLSDQAAAFIFLSTGFLALAFLLHSVWKRYFPDVGFGVLAICLLAVGAALGAIEAEWWGCEVPISSGFAFTMLSLAAIWQAMHQAKGKVAWLLLASLTYGLAIASRQNLLFGAVIFLIPLIHEWRSAGQPGAGRKMIPLLFAIACPLAVIGAGLMIYNDLRFENALDFGWNYQLGASGNGHRERQFSPHYFWYNFYYYFLEPMRWTAHFPFLQTFDPPAAPFGHEPGGKDCGGILLVNYPLALSAFAAALAWRRKAGKEPAALRLLVVILSILFFSSGLLLCLFTNTWNRFELDFLPALMILSVIGVFNLEQELTGAGRRIARLAWCLLAADTLAFNTLAGVEGYATGDSHNGNFLLRDGRPGEALKYLQDASTLEPGVAMYHNALAFAYFKTGDAVDALAEFTKALAIDPNCTQAQYDFGYFLIMSGQGEEGFKHLEKALEEDPGTNDLYASDNIYCAWSLVFNVSPGQRNGPLAIKLAETACRETGYKDAKTLVTAAEVYGENGRTHEAVSLAQRAILVAAQNGESNYLDLAKYYLALYQKNQRLVPSSPGTIRQK